MPCPALIPTQEEAMSIQAIRIHETGGPEVLRLESIELPPPGAGLVQVRHTASGINFVDIHQRSGRYPLQGFPVVLGMEGVGAVEAVGPDVQGFRLGDRVAYAAHAPGSYSQAMNVPAQHLVHLPEDIEDVQAAAMMVKGLTAQYLLRQTYRVGPGDTILVHAAAGGVGLILCQWAKHLGATVIGTVSSDAKAEVARAHGCDHPIVYTRESFVERVRELTGGEGLPVVYDSVGKDTIDGSLSCLRPCGLLASFGTASGPIPPFDLFRLNRMGSLFVTSASLYTYTAKPEVLRHSAAELFGVMRSGKVKVELHKTFPLAQAAEAHRLLQGRQTTGSMVLTL
jgi:NADPH2:quinone reductase